LRPVPLRWYRLRWPREVTPEQLAQAFRVLATTASQPVVIETIGLPGRAEHRLALPGGRATVVSKQLRAAIPGLACEGLAGRPETVVNRAVQLRLNTQRRPLTTNDLPGISRALLTALTSLRGSECLVLQWSLGRPLAPMAVPNRLEGLAHESWLGAVLLASFGPPPPLDAEARNALRAKQAEPGWQAALRLGVHATSARRQHQLIAQLVGALRGAEAPGVGFRARAMNTQPVIEARRPWRLPLRLNTSELATISAWPSGATGDLPVDRLASRLMPPTAAIPRSRRILGQATYPGLERPVALAAQDGLRHLHALGPSGSGKSTLLMQLIVQDITAGRSVVVIEPKGDLITDVLSRIPPQRLEDVVVLDPLDREQPVGLNPLQANGRSPELVADQLLGLFHSLYAVHWGPRTQDILSASLLTLARSPGMTLAALPLLLTDAGFRRRIVPRVSDPIGLEPFWRSFEAWSEAERLNAIAPAMNKLRPLLLRPDVRAIVGQARPRFELSEVLTERKVLLVNLAVGEIGPETAALLGSFVIGMLWDAIRGRTAIAPERRHPVFVVLDEFQSYLHLPTNLADALAQARGLGVGFVLAHQFMHQLSADMRSAVLANAQSRVAFRLPAEDARLVAAGSSLTPDDFSNLGAYEGYAQIVAQAAVQPWCSIRTLPPSQPTSDPVSVRAASRQRYGTPRQQIEDELHELYFGRPADADDLTPRRRHPEDRP
jgi:TraM recognition site of TraD and TraG/Type IV secretory system Conjugative DNA transfer